MTRGRTDITDIPFPHLQAHKKTLTLTALAAISPCSTKPLLAAWDEVGEYLVWYRMAPVVFGVAYLLPLPVNKAKILSRANQQQQQNFNLSDLNFSFKQRPPGLLLILLPWHRSWQQQKNL